MTQEVELEIGGDGTLHQVRIDASAPRQHGGQNDVEGCLCHFVRHVDLGRGRHSLPAIACAFCSRDHVGQEIADPLLTEKRGDGATLPSPPRSIGNQDCIAERRPKGPPRDFTFFKTVRVVQQHCPDEIRRHDVNDVAAQQARSIYTVAIQRARPSFNRIVDDRAQAPKYGQGLIRRLNSGETGGMCEHTD